MTVFLKFIYYAIIRINFYPISIFQNLGRDFGADDTGLFEFTGDNGGVTKNSPFICYKCRRFFHGGDKIRESHYCHQNIALFNFFDIVICKN